ncbi:MAG: glycosyltransferase [Microgenomates group bacterium]
MNILFISHHKWPHIGGVERHVNAISNKLNHLGHKTEIISEEDIKPPKIKILGLLYIWFWFLKNIKLIKKADIVHIHDVFIWYIPFGFLFPTKKVYITFHGWEGKFPLTMWSIYNKRIANKLTNGSIAVGSYVEKWYGIKTDFIIHGGIEKLEKNKQSLPLRGKNSIVWLGRTDKDTGYLEFQKWLSTQKVNYKVTYVTNVKNPEKYLKTAEYCVPSGYLSYLEAKSYGCKIMIFANNPLKEDYWNEIKKLKKIPTWDVIVKVYIKLWKSDIFEK